MVVADLVKAMESLADPAFAEEWDNVGLIVGDPARAVGGPMLVTVDFRPAVVEEAVGLGVSAIVCYHPPIFRPISRLSGPGVLSLALLRAIEAGIAVYSPHTALDAAKDGLTDWLCGALAPIGEDPSSSFGDLRALDPVAEFPSRADHKIVTFVPRGDVAKVRDALATIGAGKIGLYERCSFEMEGSGTFHAQGGAIPSRGTAGAFEQVDEVRLEMVCPKPALGLAREMLERFHPYEEPAWDVYALVPKPNRRVGAGRRLTLDRPARPSEIAERVKANLGIPIVKTALADDEPVSRVGVCAGSGAALLDAAIDDGCTLYFTGELSHHAGLAAINRGCGVLLAGHTNTERGYMPVLAKRLGAALGGYDVRVSTLDTPLFRSR